MRVVAILAAIVIATSCGAADMQRFKGGPLDGMGGLGEPSLPNASPVPADARAALTALRSAYQAGHPERAKAFLANADVRLVEIDTEGDPKDRPGTGKVTGREVNTPYAVTSPIGDVRLEWISGGKVYYVSWVKLEGGKIASMTRMSETPPVLVVN